MRLLGRYGYHLLVLAAAAGAAWGWHAWQLDPPLVGTVETLVHRVAFREGGRLTSLSADVGSPVLAGALLARLDDADLVGQRRRLETELAYVEDLLDADRQRFGLEYSRLQLQLATDEHWLARQYATVQSRLAELNALNAEVERLGRAEDAGLGRGRDLGDLTVQRDATARYVAESTGEMAKLRGRDKAGDQAEVQEGDVVASLLGDRMEHLHELLRDLVVLEQRQAYRSLVAPCDGHVVEVLRRPGDTVDAYEPVLAVEDARVRHAVVYVPETQDLRVSVGDRVAIHSRRARTFDTEGQVAFIHPGYAPLPDRFALRGQVAWARKLRVRLPAEHSLVPGELLRVEVVRGAAPALTPAAQAAAKPTRQPTPLPLDVPAALAARTRFEPSGAIWLADLGRFLVVSDDTGTKSRNDHAPWVFLVDDAGRVEPEPLVLEGIDTVNDLEAVTGLGDGRLLLVSSNAASRKGRRPASRQWLLEVRREGRRLVAGRRARLLPALLASYDPAQLAALGLSERADDGLPLLNVEGAAWRDGALYLGLKQPVGPEGAIIWRVDALERLLGTGRLEPGQVTLYGRADLRTPDGRPRGVSELAFDAAGGMLALSTLPGVPDDAQLGGLHRLVRADDGRIAVETLASFPGRKPEALATSGAKHLTVLFDADAATPAWVELEL